MAIYVQMGDKLKENLQKVSQEEKRHVYSPTCENMMKDDSSFSVEQCLWVCFFFNQNEPSFQVT